MKLNELVANKPFENLIATIVSAGEVVEKEVGGNPTKMQDGVLEDDTDQIRFTFWGDAAGQFKPGDKVIIKGFCKIFMDDKQVTNGKYGHVKLVPKLDPVM